MDSRRLRRAIIPASLLTLLFLYSYACVPKRISDLRVVGLARISAADLPPAEEMRRWLALRGEAVWKLALAADAGWIGEVRSQELNSYPVVVRCDHPDWELLALGPYVGQTRLTYSGDGLDALVDGNGSVHYDIYLPETGHYRSQNDFNAAMPPYDLRTEKLALCVSIAGGAMTGAYNRSNEVRVVVGEQPHVCVPVLPGWAAPDGTAPMITTNTVQVRGRQLRWNGVAVDEATLGRYLQAASKMFPVPFLIFDPETNDCTLAKRVRDLIDRNYPCRDGACGQGTREVFLNPTYQNRRDSRP